jgi:hypothetical protein
MTSRRGQFRLQYLVVACTLVLAAAFAAAALGFVDVYVNPFSKRGEVRQVSLVKGGKNCDRDFLKKRGVMEINVKSGPAACIYKAPVQGDSAHPDHRFEAQGRILKTTKTAIRDDAYLSIAVRVGGGDRYELRVFPKGRKFVLRRQPGGAGFPVNGTDPAIGTPGQLNKMKLTAIGNRVTAHVNGARVADVNDANASSIKGRKVEFGVGTRANTGKDTDGNFTKLKLSVPDP